MCTKSEAYSPTQNNHKQSQTAQNNLQNSSRLRPSAQSLTTPLPRAGLSPAFHARRKRLTGSFPCGLWSSEEEPCLVSGSWPGCPAPSGSGVLGAAVQMSRPGPCVPRSAMPAALVAGVRGSGKPRGCRPCEHKPPIRASCAVGAGPLAGWVVVSNTWPRLPRLIERWVIAPRSAVPG